MYLLKGYGVKRLIKEFATKVWKKTTLNSILKQLVWRILTRTLTLSVSTYYHDVLHSQHMFAAICQLAREVYVFQQDSAVAHCARSTVKFLHKEVPYFIQTEL